MYKVLYSLSLSKTILFVTNILLFRLWRELRTLLTKSEKLCFNLRPVSSTKTSSWPSIFPHEPRHQRVCSAIPSQVDGAMITLKLGLPTGSICEAYPETLLFCMCLRFHIALYPGCRQHICRPGCFYSILFVAGAPYPPWHRQSLCPTCQPRVARAWFSPRCFVPTRHHDPIR